MAILEELIAETPADGGGARWYACHDTATGHYFIEERTEGERDSDFQRHAIVGWKGPGRENVRRAMQDLAARALSEHGEV